MLDVIPLPKRWRDDFRLENLPSAYEVDHIPIGRMTPHGEFGTWKASSTSIISLPANGLVSVEVLPAQE